MQKASVLNRFWLKISVKYKYDVCVCLWHRSYRMDQRYIGRDAINQELNSEVMNRFDLFLLMFKQRLGMF